MATIPVRGSRRTGGHPRMHGVDQELQVLDAGVGRDTVAEVEDVPRAAAGSAQDVARALAHEPGRTEQQGRLEVALNAAVMADARPRLVQVDAPVQRDYVGASASDRLEQMRR